MSAWWRKDRHADRRPFLSARAAIARAVREWFWAQGFTEAEPTMLTVSPGAETHIDAFEVGERYLHTSPEFAMKRALAAGLPRIYQIAPCFRDEEQGVHHSREFTMLEWYRVGAGTEDLMDEVEELIAAAAQAVARPVPRFERHAVSELIVDRGNPDAWFLEWVDRVEPSLTRPTIVYGYPAWQAALARLRGGVADRFEVYLGGIELANAFGEETDADELRARMGASAERRRAAGREPHPVDEAFLEAVRRMPRCAGIAMGVDRLVMALLEISDIRRVQVVRPRAG